MQLLDIPGELLLCITANLSSARDILPFALVSRSTSGLLSAALYNFNVQRQNNSALHWAAQRGKPKTADIILHRYRPDANAVYHTNTPLVWAATYGPESVVNLLLTSRDISANFQNQQGQCALWCVALQGYAGIVDLLLQHGHQIRSRGATAWRLYFHVG